MASGKRRNAVYIVILSMILVGLLAVAFILSGSQTSKLPLALKISNNDVTETIRPWCDDNGTWYFFMPSYASGNNTVLVSDESGCYLQNELLSGERPIDAFEIGKEYAFEQHGTFSNRDAAIVFLKSANVATMYIDTLSGSMKKVHADKNNKEKINMTLYGESGEQLYSGNEYADEISGRGNATWGLKKKPYKINLSKPTALLGMPKAQKWVLLANAYDETNLRNKLIYDFAEKVDMGWTPHCEYVDLYLNGEYNGLYLLSEKIEVVDNRFFVNDADSDYLFESIYADRLQSDDVSFSITGNHYFVINYPQKSDESKINEIRQSVDLLDAEIKAGDLSRIDLNSWVTRFLIDEVFINWDAIQLSSFYHYDTSSGKFYAGPIWDYDVSFGNDILELKSKEPKQLWGVKKYWYSQLYQNEIFYKKLKQVYQEKFLPRLEGMLAEDLPHLRNRISVSSTNNSIRWDKMFKASYAEDKELDVRINDLSDFMTARLSYLEPIWCTDKEYEIVKWYAADKTSLLDITVVEYGTTITEFPIQNESPNYEWNNLSDDTAFDVTLPITANIELYSNVQTSQNAADLTEFLTVHKAMILLFVFCAMFGFSGLLLLCVDIRRSRKRRDR